MPSGLWMPETTPSADNFASRGPDRISIDTPQMRSALAMKSGPLLASRQAAVAIAWTRPTFITLHSARNRRNDVKRLGDGIRRQQAGGLNFAAESAQRLFVEDRDQAARHRFIDDETHRVRADVDDRDAGCAFARPLHRAEPLMTAADARYGA